MWIRTRDRVGSIVGASGCFYGIRRSVHRLPLPPGLSWDFASVLVARTQGFRSVNVPAAICIVPRAAKIRTELRRKVRTMARGLSTLFYHRALITAVRQLSFMLIAKLWGATFGPVSLAHSASGEEAQCARALGAVADGLIKAGRDHYRRLTTPKAALAGFALRCFVQAFCLGEDSTDANGNMGPTPRTTQE